MEINKEKLAEKITTGIGIGKFVDKPPRIANFLLGFNAAEQHYLKIIEEKQENLEAFNKANLFLMKDLQQAKDLLKSSVEFMNNVPNKKYGNNYDICSKIEEFLNK